VPKAFVAGALRWTPLGELTRPQTPSWILESRFVAGVGEKEGEG